jgi:hypothetical protein
MASSREAAGEVRTGNIGSDFAAVKSFDFDAWNPVGDCARSQGIS